MKKLFAVVVMLALTLGTIGCGKKDSGTGTGSPTGNTSGSSGSR